MSDIEPFTEEQSVVGPGLQGGAHAVEYITQSVKWPRPNTTPFHLLQKRNSQPYSDHEQAQQHTRGFDPVQVGSGPSTRPFWWVVRVFKEI